MGAPLVLDGSPTPHAILGLTERYIGLGWYAVRIERGPAVVRRQARGCQAARVAPKGATDAAVGPSEAGRRQARDRHPTGRRPASAGLREARRAD